ncbi:MAG: phage major tail tube protein [Synergistaceae bacterium]|nr:phage major tail tube protein [Synergistaceae bacterium]
MKQPEAYIDFSVFENGDTLIGVASATLPNIAFLTQTISGAGIGGNVQAVLAGMVDAMSLTLNFRSVTGAATHLSTPEKHLIDLRLAEQYWEQTEAQKVVQADKFIMVVVPRTTNPGAVAPASASDASGEYSVYRYEAYKDGEELWCIDPFNRICRINGVDYFAPINKALGL